jgi:tetratricopeptide (TPR) repeat protein
MNHLDADSLFRYQEGLLEGEGASQVSGHLAECEGCRQRIEAVKTFDVRMTAEWLRTRLGTIVPEEWGCPAPEEWSRLFLGEVADEAGRRRLESHLAGCGRCRETVGEMEEVFRGLQHADPLAARRPSGETPWWERVRSLVGITPWPMWAGATAAIAIAFVAGLLSREIIFRPVVLQPSREVIRIAKPAFIPQPELPAFGIAPMHKPEAQKVFREAMTFYAEPDFPDRAIPKLREAVAIDPAHDQAQFWLGIAYLLKNETKAAIPPLAEAARLAPWKAEYTQYLAWAYLKLGENEKALNLQTDLLKKR